MKYNMFLENANNCRVVRELGSFVSIAACDKKAREMVAEGSWPVDGKELAVVEVSETGTPVSEIYYNAEPDEDGFGCVRIEHSKTPRC